MSLTIQPRADLLDHTPGEPPAPWRAAWKRVLTHTHTYSGRPDHGGTVTPPDSYRQLSQWAHGLGVDAVGMGSPYTPRSASVHHRYDGQDRGTYYSQDFDRRSVRQLDEIERMLAEMTSHASNGTLFYLDNETPKGRYGHLWWVGYYPEYAPWHDYDQDFDRWMLRQSVPGDDSAEPMPYNRRPYAEVVACQRRHGALGFWAHPTSWWLDREGRFITNIASELPAHLLAEGFADGMVVMGYHPYRPAYLALWHKLLDAGFRLPGVAEMDVGLSNEATWQRERAMLNHVWHASDAAVGERLTPAALTAAFASGRLSASTEPLVDLTVDHQPMGAVAETEAGHTHMIELAVHGAEPGQHLARVELRGRGNALLWAADDLPAGRVRLTLPGFDERAYVTARVFGDCVPSTERSFRDVKAFAVSNPVYLHPPGQTFERGMSTRVRIELADESPYLGGVVRFEDAAGELLERGVLTRRGAAVTVPAHGRVTCVTAEGQSQTRYLINANARLQEVQRYLYRGRFRRDYPDCVSGEVPPEAWRLDDYREAMEAVTLRF